MSVPASALVPVRGLTRPVAAFARKTTLKRPDVAALLSALARETR
jgi:hypothetical protein